VARAYRTFDDEDSIEDDFDLLTALVIESASEQRHLFRKKYRSGRKKGVAFTDDLQQLQLNFEHQDDDGNTHNSMPDEAPWLTDSAFLQKYCVTRPSFENIRQKVENNVVFQKKISRG
jgi:hypothetical protein